MSLWRKIIIILLVIALGYVSNGLSHGACLENAAFWYSNVLMSGQPFYVKLESGQENVRQALDKVQAPYSLITSPSEKSFFPQVSIQTKAWLPFVISEEFDAAMNARRRAKFTAYYLTFFGMPVSIGDSFDIPTDIP